jgi:uncharacterized protein YndB with AHSA1/START domain
MRVNASVVLPVPRERAWALVTRWEQQARWLRDADRVDVLGDLREGVGVRLAVRTRVFGVPAFTEVLEVTTWRPPERLEIAHRSFVHGGGVWAFEPHELGTRFTWSEELSLPVPRLGELALLVYRPFLRWVMRRALVELRALAIAS